MSRRIKVLQLQPDYNVKAHDFADLAEQIVKALPGERYEVVAAFLRGKPQPGEPVSRAARSAILAGLCVRLYRAQYGGHH